MNEGGPCALLYHTGRGASTQAEETTQSQFLRRQALHEVKELRLLLKPDSGHVG
jgi:hypothetical protein